jgi:hypothetical protein
VKLARWSVIWIWPASIAALRERDVGVVVDEPGGCWRLRFRGGGLMVWVCVRFLVDAGGDDPGGLSVSSDEDMAGEY